MGIFRSRDSRKNEREHIWAYLQNAECALMNLQNADFSVCQNAHIQGMPKRGLSKECLFDTLSVSH